MRYELATTRARRDDDVHKITYYYCVCACVCVFTYVAFRACAHAVVHVCV